MTEEKLVACKECKHSKLKDGYLICGHPMWDHAGPFDAENGCYQPLRQPVGNINHDGHCNDFEPYDGPRRFVTLAEVLQTPPWDDTDLTDAICKYTLFGRLSRWLAGERS